MTVDRRMPESMQRNYVHMSDEQLAFIASSKFDDLSEEARTALQNVIATRQPDQFESELATIKAALRRRLVDAERLVRHRQRSERYRHWLINVLALALVGAGITIALVGDTSTGIVVAALGPALYLAALMRRTMVRFVWAVLKP